MKSACVGVLSTIEVLLTVFILHGHGIPFWHLIFYILPKSVLLKINFQFCKLFDLTLYIHYRNFLSSSSQVGVFKLKYVPIFVIPMFVIFLKIPRDHEHLKWAIPHGDVNRSCNVCHVILCRSVGIVSTAEHLVSNVTIISAKWSGEDVEGNGCDVIQHVTQLVWRDWGNQWRPRSGQPVKGYRFKYRTFVMTKQECDPPTGVGQDAIRKRRYYLQNHHQQ